VFPVFAAESVVIMDMGQDLEGLYTAATRRERLKNALPNNKPNSPATLEGSGITVLSGS